MTPDYSNVLVIRSGPLGKFVQALAAAKTIREYHYDGRITLLTTADCAALGRSCPYFDTVWENGAANTSLSKLKMLDRISKEKFGRIYDLQTSHETNGLLKPLWPMRPEWVSTAEGPSRPYKNKKRSKMHTIDRQAERLAMAGVGLGRGRVGGMAPPPDLDWIEDIQKRAPRTEPTRLGVRRPFALLVPGGSPQSPNKCWPAEYFGNLAMFLKRSGIMPVIVGTECEREISYSIQETCPGALSLINRTDHIQLAVLARQADLAVGNDTDLMHLIAAARCPSVVLLSSASEPEISAPRGKNVSILQKKNLADAGVGEVCDVLQAKDLIASNKHPASPPHLAN